jgi:hypothetical protein
MQCVNTVLILIVYMIASLPYTLLMDMPSGFVISAALCVLHTNNFFSVMNK